MSSPTGPTSTIASSICSPSPEARAAVIACGALAADVERVATARGWPVDVHPLPPLLHNRPSHIAPAVETLAATLRGRYATVAVAYADCGTYGALDEVCGRLGLRRLGGAHCYDVLAGAGRMRSLLSREPGTYVLTDFLVRSFERTVVAELGLDRWPELRDDYFGHYRRVVWLAQRPTARLSALAEAAADRLGLPLSVLRVGDAGLERELAALLS
ncbi:DUF1638 domain-containing protein [Asanoa iriomotensis]|uniref:DUF1638 domain-containing protein n=1 Tax=Asanoa iriomotensis TaxID=234613 RepID=A0ABQ4C209_9ACTN|nr:DUF1638 domain-containing protein [Asanoa iriomotensis]GIF56808.1 hypothetical protein Air01nite_29030 [Asanoa iriomotensis]